MIPSNDRLQNMCSDIKNHYSNSVFSVKCEPEIDPYLALLKNLPQNPNRY